METLTISKPGKTKNELLSSLKKLLAQYNSQLDDFNGEVTEIPDGYKIYSRKFIFTLDAEITAEDGKYTIKYETNAPKHYVNKGLGIVTDTLEGI